MDVAVALALGSAIIPLDLPPRPRVDPCPMFDRAPPAAVARPVTSRDLATMADIGRSDPNDAPSPFGVSPDGRQIAFIVRRGNPSANGYCQRLLVMPLDARTAPVERDRGGTFIRDLFDLRNFTAFAAGWARVVAPRWSPDGRSLAFLKRVDDATQVWLVDVAGGTEAHRATAMPDDVEDVAWTADGTGLVVATRPAVRRQLEAIADEAVGGYLFDDRFGPHFANQPLPTEPVPLDYARWGLVDGAVRPATTDDIARLVPARPGQIPAGARIFAIAPTGNIAWTEPRDAGALLSASQLVIADASGKRVVCDQPRCTGVSRLWWSDDSRTLFAVQRTGWPASQTRLLGWRIGTPAPRTVMTTDDALIGCGRSGDALICAREGATRPRRLVAIDPNTGRERLIYDPNPDFARLRLGASQRFHIRNAYGLASVADLVLPPDHRKGERHPLVVVQYTSDGFLRGGTGDEVPIQALAGRGFAVLSFSRPDFVPAALAAGNELAMRQANRKDWIDRRNVQSSLDLAVQRAIATGTIDPDRMGISGFSDGASTTQWALINTRLFKVAALGSCCEDMQAYPLTGGPAFERYGREMGYRFFEPDAPIVWKPMSLALNADRLATPILVQTGDSEYEVGLDVVSAWRRHGNPIELFVLDHEGHFKVQPAHRLAMYERTVDWFAFWLKREMDCGSTAKNAQYARWRAMKGAPANARCAPSASPSP